MKFKKYQDIMPSNRTNFTMVYNYAARTLTQIETILKQAYGNPLPDRPKRRLERMRHKMEQMVARHRILLSCLFLPKICCFAGLKVINRFNYFYNFGCWRDIVDDIIHILISHRAFIQRVLVNRGSVNTLH